MPSQAMVQRKQGPVVGPIEFPKPKLVMAPPDMRPWKMSPPSLSPLHMSPPNMELPNFSPIQDHMPLPTLTASKFSPPTSFLNTEVELPPSAAVFAPGDPSILVIGTFDADASSSPESPSAVNKPGAVLLYKVSDVEQEVRGDREVLHTDTPRKKVRPSLQLLAQSDTPSPVTDLVFSPHDQNLLVATTCTGAIILYEIIFEDGSMDILSTHQLFNQSTVISSVAFSPTDPTLFACTLNTGAVATVKMTEDYEADDSCKIQFNIEGHEHDATSAVFSNDGKRLYTVGEDHTISSWDFKKGQPRQKWTDDDVHNSGITSVVCWPPPNGADREQKRKLLLTGTYDGKFRALDMSERWRPPPVTHESDMEGGIWRITALPPLPKLDKIDSIGAGVWSADANPDIETDPAHVGCIVSCMKAGSRLMIQKQKFEELFLEGDDNGKERPNDWVHFTVDGVKKDWYGRELIYEWYHLATFGVRDKGYTTEEGELGPNCECYASAPVAIIDYDPLFKDSGKQRLRRGWRIASTSFKNKKIGFWHVYVE